MMLLSTVAAILAILAVAAAARVLGRWWKYRGERVISCPGNHRPAGISVHAVGSTKLRIAACSRWPERAGCGQECLSQVAEAPKDCLVRNILVRWYGGKRCASCGEPFSEIPLAGAKPAILQPDGMSVEWNQVPAERLEETLAAASPVCFACHLGNLLVRTHPELVVDRHRNPELSGTPGDRL